MKLPLIPPAVEEPVASFLRDLLIAIRDSDDRTVKKDIATGSIYLLSPGKKVYSVSVDDAGTVTTTLVKE